MDVRHLNLTGDLGRVINYPFSPRHEGSIKRAMEGCDVVINLIGKDYDRNTFTVVGEPWSGRGECRDSNRLARSEECGGDSLFTYPLWPRRRTVLGLGPGKALGEEEVKRSFPGATIVRPADVFGDEDRFWIHTHLWHALPRLLLNNDGTPLKQPVWCNDVANAIHAMVQNPGDRHIRTRGSRRDEYKRSRGAGVSTDSSSSWSVDLPPLFLQSGDSDGVRSESQDDSNKLKLIHDYFEIRLECVRTSRYHPSGMHLHSFLHNVSVVTFGES